MLKKCRTKVDGKHIRYLRDALVVAAFTVALGAAGNFQSRAYGITVSAAIQEPGNAQTGAEEQEPERIENAQSGAEEQKPEEVQSGTVGQTVPVSDSGEASERAEMTDEPIRMTDLTRAFQVILQGATKEFIAGYRVDDAFLMWLDAQYGDEAVLEIAYAVMDEEMDVDVWRQATGNSIHVLWLSFCESTGFQSEMLENVYWIDCGDTDETVLSFTGDFNFAEGWYTTEYMESQPNGIYDCFSEELLAIMKESDLLVMNNEFVYSDRGAPLPGKAYTFRAEPEKAELLSVFGVDLANLGNNHVYDYGEEALLDTMEILREMEIPYVGAGEDLAEASKIVYYVANGRKIAIVSATEIERSTQYTKEATENSAGVFKTLHPERFVAVIKEARAVSDYVIVIPHWGTEGNLYPDQSQRFLAQTFAEAGADAVIGGHPHRLQGVAFYDEIPVAYSLGNFWFSNAALYTTVVQVVIGEDGSLRLKYLPCLQKDLTTSLITDKTEMDDFYHYLAAISSNIGIDAEGNIYPKTASDYASEVIYDSDTSTTAVIGGADNEGNAIDIVGNLK